MTATIASVILPGVYLIRDDAGKSHRARSAETWRRGDRVTVLDGQIIGRAGVAGITRTYEV
jgi:hypothetical protein